MGKTLNLFKRRQARNRKSLRSRSDRPRLSVFRSAKNIYAQIIDDSKGITLASASSLVITDKLSNTDMANRVGLEIASRAVQCGVTEVVFDRGAYLYHGRVKSLADGARAGGLKF
jgi:large subunit ribosomal protein L18